MTILVLAAALAWGAYVPPRPSPTPRPTATPAPVPADAEDLAEYIPRFLYATQKVGDLKIEWEAWTEYREKIRRRQMVKHQWKVGDTWNYDPTEKVYRFAGSEYAQPVSGTAR